jgi:hypothetical protein
MELETIKVLDEDDFNDIDDNFNDYSTFDISL